MARAKDLWWTTGKRGEKRKTTRHPDNGGDPDAKRWLAIWVVDGREQSQAFRTQALAEKHARTMQADLDRGEYLDPAAGRTPVSVLAAKWLSLRESTAGTRQRYESCYRRHVEPEFGSRQAGSVRASEVAAWSRSMAGHPATRVMAVMILGGIFDLAVADGIRRDNPARSAVVGRPSARRDAPPPREPWDAERIRAVSRACGQHSAAPLAAAGLGLREGELFGLGGEDVDQDGGIVRVRRQLARVGGRYIFKLPKGGKARAVPLPLGVATLVRQIDSPESISLPWLKEDGTERSRPESVPLLFRWTDGQFIQAWAWRRYVWMPALAKAGVIPAYTGRNFPDARQHGMHALRHWYSTLLQDSGVSLAGVIEFLGHSRKSAPLAVGVYGHVTEATFEAARNAVDQALFGLRLVTSDGTVTELRNAR